MLRRYWSYHLQTLENVLKQYPYRLPSPSKVELIEVTDTQDRPLMVVPRVAVRKLGLIRRVVLVALWDKEFRLYIQQRGLQCDAMPGFWDLSATGHVQAGESRHDAARRELAEEIGVTHARLIRVAEDPPTPAKLSFATLFVAGPSHEVPVPNPDEVNDGLFLTELEVRSLLLSDPDRVTPSLLWAFKSGLAFPRKR